MQVLNEQEQNSVIPGKIPALIFRKDLPDMAKKQSEQKKSEVIKENKPSKSERKMQRNEFLEKIHQIEPPGPITESEVINDEFEQEESIGNSYTSEFDGKRLMGWMSELLEQVREWIQYCRKPPISDDQHENRAIRNQIENYKKTTLFHDADSIHDCIEGLMWYGIGNKNLFGEQNYLLNETIKGYKPIYDEIVKLKGQEGKGDEALRWLGKLIICAARPLVVDELLVKDTEFEPSIGEGGVFGGDYEE